MMKKLLLLFLLLPIFSAAQTITPNWSVFGAGSHSFSVGFTGQTGGRKTLIDSINLYLRFLAKIDSTANNGYVTHGNFNSHFRQGLTNVGGYGELGGTFLHNSITQMGDYSLNYTANNSANTLGSGFQLGYAGGLLQSYSLTTANYSDFIFNQDGWKLEYTDPSNFVFRIGSTGQVNDDIRSKGWFNSNDYSAVGELDSLWLTQLNSVKKFIKRDSVKNAGLYLKKANNLSDVASAPTSATNLGLGINNDVNFRKLLLNGSSTFTSYNAGLSINKNITLIGDSLSASLLDISGTIDAGSYVGQHHYSIYNRSLMPSLFSGDMYVSGRVATNDIQINYDATGIIPGPYYLNFRNHTGTNIGRVFDADGHYTWGSVNNLGTIFGVDGSFRANNTVRFDGLPTGTPANQVYLDSSGNLIKAALGSYEVTSNKVTTLDNSTTHYPSTSAVTTSLSTKVDSVGLYGVQNDVLTTLKNTASTIIIANTAIFGDGSGVSFLKAGNNYQHSFIADTWYAVHAYPTNFTSSFIITLANKFIANKDGSGNFPIMLNATTGLGTFISGCDIIGFRPTGDGAFFIPSMYLLYYQKSADISYFNTHGSELQTALDNIPLDGSGLVNISTTAAQNWVPWGFQDGIRSTGANLMGTLLYYKACLDMATMYTANGQAANATTMTNRATTIANNITATLWDSTDGMFYNAGTNNRQIDILGSAYAIYLGITTTAQKNSIASYLVSNYSTLVSKGFIRQSPTNWSFSWNGNQCTRGTGNYDDGFWSVGNEWVTYAIYQNSPSMAYRFVSEFMANSDQTQEYYGTTGNGSTGNLESPMGALAFVNLSGLYQTGTSISRFIPNSTPIIGQPLINLGNNLIGLGSANFTANGKSINLNTPFSTLNIPVTIDQVTNYQRLAIGQTSATYFFNSLNGGTQNALPINLNVNGANILIQNASVTGNTGAVDITRSGGHVITAEIGGTLTSASAYQKALAITPTYTQSSTGGNAALWISPFRSSVGSGNQYLIDAGTNTAADGQGTHTSIFNLSYNGIINLANAATPGTNVANNIWMSGGYPKMEDGTNVLKFVLNNNTTPLTASGLLGTDASSFASIITALPSTTTATTQTPLSADTKVATDLYVDNALTAWKTATATVTNKTFTTGNIWQGNVITPAYLGTGTPTSSNFLRGDGTWATAVTSVATANGVSATNAAGVLTFTLGAIAPTSVAASTSVTGTDIAATNSLAVTSARLITSALFENTLGTAASVIMRGGDATHANVIFQNPATTQTGAVYGDGHAVFSGSLAGTQLKTTAPVSYSTGGYNVAVVNTSSGNIETIAGGVPIHGNSTTTGTATTRVTVTIGVTMSNTNYAAFITPKDLLTAVNYWVDPATITTATFDVVFITALTGSINFDWVVIP